jgi:transcriptional regulator with XRE-family HTH domain
MPGTPFTARLAGRFVRGLPETSLRSATLSGQPSHSELPSVGWQAKPVKPKGPPIDHDERLSRTRDLESAWFDGPCRPAPSATGLDGAAMDNGKRKGFEHVSAIRKTVGTRVRALRLARHLTQEQLGHRAHLSYKFIGEVERGIGNPTIETLVDIAAALEVDLDELTSATNGKSPRGVSALDAAALRDARRAIDAVLGRLGPSKRRRGR